MAVIGIDFGSSYSSASWINPKSGKAEPIVFRDSDVKLPSVMLYNKGGFICGYQAASFLEEAYKLPPIERFEIMQNFVPCLKSSMAPNATEFFGDNDYNYTELLTIYFEYLIRLAQQHCGADYKITNVVFSHPVEFEESKIRMMRSAFEELGLKVDKVQYEPVSAIFGHSLNHIINEEEGLLVFDFGGGTIDVAFVRKSGGKLFLSAKPRGDSNCGGNDLNYLIYEHFRSLIKKQYGYDITRQGSVDFAILNICKKLKEAFSGKNDIYEMPGMVVINGKLQPYKFTLSREAFYNIIYAKVYDAVNVALTEGKEVAANGYHIDRVLLIGGSSRLTLVSELLAKEFPDAKIETCGEKDIAVALGNIADNVKQELPYEIREGIKIEKKHISIKCPECGSEDCLKLYNRKDYHCFKCKNDVKLPYIIRDGIKIKEKQISCPQCGSNDCFKLYEKKGYHCFGCSWEGPNVKVLY